ncbi:four-carbon acid sugar kinase family protein [Clostridium sp. D2Q-14]|uniref:four-carbon acid sugar kinase family protein n=1 Tax=Anaeromonas gelatinilytica TaxID=2683194 RepID=UPI00193C69E5|nr:four-carbon acid sugar kinase family protein [Anaeromonas gelatinilytica]MBS4535650.1 four-carbon acid sugar kinase family protein [Anaeromonas gelatinilytica]
MPDVVIIADDLTGANATSVLIARQGYKSATFLNLDNYLEEKHKDFDVVSITTDSRSIEEQIAYKRVKKVVNFFENKDVKLISKRIDSTVRGNIGAEIDAVLDTLSWNEIAIMVPAFPSSERVTIGGFLMVDSIPLEQTDVAKDPKTPVSISFIPKLLRKQSKYNVGTIGLDKVLEGAEAVKERIIENKEKGNRIIIIDATTNKDIETIARASKSSNLNIVAVDPGPFTSELTKELLGKTKKTLGKKVMITIGSVTNLTRRQIEHFRLKYNPLLVSVDSEKLIYEDTRKAEINKAVNYLVNNLEDYEVIGVITTNDEGEVLNLKEIAKDLGVTEDDVAQRISTALAIITRTVMDNSNNKIGGLYTSGGDVTVDICHVLKTVGIEVKDEILPLAVYGRVIEGKYPDMPIVTKGGLVGEDDALIKCVDYLQTKISNDYNDKM